MTSLDTETAMNRDEGLPDPYVVAIEQIVEVLYACTECEQFTCDEATLTANSACDAIEAIDAILRHHDLIPVEVQHADDCPHTA